MRFGEALAEARKWRGISQHRLALVSDTSQRHISFLETGRSRPTREMILRLSDGLGLRPRRRADLFEAAGFTSPYRRSRMDDATVTDALRQLENYTLAPWPYPALALTETWDVVAANRRGRALFGLPAATVDTPVNLFDILLDEKFRAGISNWPQVAAVVLSRLRRHAIDHPQFRARLDTAIATGVFRGDDVPDQGDVPVILPLVFALPDGGNFRMTSMTARLTSTQDDFVNGLEIELCVPLDEESARYLSQVPVDS